MKKSVFKFLLILSLAGNISTLLFFSGFADIVKPESSVPIGDSDAELFKRVQRIALEEERLKEKEKKQKGRLEDLSREAKLLKAQLVKRRSRLNLGEGSTGPRRTKNSRAQVAKDGVKKALLAFGKVDGKGQLIEGIDSEKHCEQFIRDIIPFLGQKESVFAALADILKDQERKGHHRFALDCLFVTMSVTGVNRDIDEQFMSLLNDQNVDTALRKDLAESMNFQDYKKDSIVADKLMRIIQNSKGDLRAAILTKLDCFELDEVSATVARIAFDRSESPQARQAALGSLKNSEEYQRDLLALTKDKSKELKVRAFRLLSEQRSVPGFFEQIEQTVKSEKNEDILWCMASYVSQTKDPKAMAVLQEIESRSNIDTYLRDFARMMREEIAKKTEQSKEGAKDQ